MQLSSEFGELDPMSHFLRLVRVRSTVYCRSVLEAPWGFEVAAHGQPSFHVVVAGRCRLEVDGEFEHALEAGDLVILPRGPRHWMRDQPGSPATELEEILANEHQGGGSVLRHGGGGERTELLCGGFTLDAGHAAPVLGMLPPAFRIAGTGGEPVPWLAATLAMLDAETAADAPGSAEVINRLADALLTQALRAALAEAQASAVGLVSLTDPEIATAIELIHRQPERAWAVGDVASEVSLSRSAFAARFRDVVGESPKRYIVRTRLAHAASLLRRTDTSIAQIATQAGYSSEFSFSKAFKRSFGVAPGAYRGEPNGTPSLTVAHDTAR